MCTSHNKIPQHVAIIMDGNGRWAQSMGHGRSYGHSSSTRYLNQIVQRSCDLGIKHLSLFGFSTENWNRPASEVSHIFDVIERAVNEEIEKVLEHGVNISIVGDMQGIPEKCRLALKRVVEKSQNNSTFFLTLAINYSGRWEMVSAVKNLLEEVNSSKSTVNIEDFDYSKLNSYMATKNLPEIDLMIRTGGECRLSNFMIFKLAYAELYFTDVMWPDFTDKDYECAIVEYKKRSRRFGKL